MIKPSLNPLSTDVKKTSVIARKVLSEALSDIRVKLLTPPVQSDLSVWSDENIVLGQTSPEPGLWRTDRTPYLREVLDVCGDLRTQRTVFMASAQVGKTSVLINTAAFYVAQDPCPIMVVEPDKSMAESFSLTKLEPVINESPVLRRTVASTRKRDGGSKRLEKVFHGGFITMVSAKSAHSLRSRSIRVLLLDEIDAYDQSISDEGDPVRLAEARTTTFSNRKVILTSTPTLKGFSRIEKEYLASDQRKYQVPCPHCTKYQVLKFGTEETTYGLKWTKGNHSDVKYMCEHCGVLIDESYKLQMLLKGKWVAENPSSNVVGFHINALYSPWVRWNGQKGIVEQWLEVYNLPDKRQSFYNLVLGEPYEDTENQIDAGELTTNISVYSSQVPSGAGVLCAGIDVQESWIEVGVWAFGKDEEMWLVDTVQLVGETTQQYVWDELKAFLNNKYRTFSGDMVPITVSAIDSGNQTDIVYKKVRELKHHGLNIHPVKGFDGARAAFDWSRFKKQGQARLGIVGSSAVKGILYARLKTVKQHGAGFIHFPSGIHHEVLEQILAERKMVTVSKLGVPTVIWKRIRARNEQLDCMVYAYAIFQSLGLHYINVELPKTITLWSKEPDVVVSNGEVTDVAPPEVTVSGFAKRTVMKMPRRSGGLIQTNWLR